MLSRAENDVVLNLKKGKSNKEIADILCVSEKTIKFHLTNVYRKMGVRSRSELMAMEQGNFVATDLIIEEARLTNFKGSDEMESIPTGARPLDEGGIMTIQEARRLEQGSRQVQVIKKSQEDKITFIDDKFKVGETITQLHSMMKDVTSKELTPATVNAACNCVARLNETINTAIQAARFLNER